MPLASRGIGNMPCMADRMYVAVWGFCLGRFAESYVKFNRRWTKVQLGDWNGPSDFILSVALDTPSRGQDRVAMAETLATSAVFLCDRGAI
jgi:hypothetical protein